MQGRQIVLITTCLAKALLKGAGSRHQERSRAAGRVADLQARKPVGITPAVFNAGPIRRHGQFSQQNGRRRAGVVRPVVLCGLKKPVVQGSGMIELQPANVRRAVENTLEQDPE